jgi:hypothetical protein
MPDRSYLAKCPWCGGLPDITNPALFHTDESGKWGALGCCGTGPDVRTDYKPLSHWRQDAVDAWNERPSDLAVMGCICPIGAEQTCTGLLCPRQRVGAAR